jgi:hypothetical protein
MLFQGTLLRLANYLGFTQIPDHEKMFIIIKGQDLYPIYNLIIKKVVI